MMMRRGWGEGVAECPPSYADIEYPINRQTPPGGAQRAVFRRKLKARSIKHHIAQGFQEKRSAVPGRFWKSARRKTSVPPILFHE
ncbi:MAG: hypothetical protein V4764_15535 [Burkholderia sp.]